MPLGGLDGGTLPAAAGPNGGGGDIVEWSPAPFYHRFGRFSTKKGEGATKTVYEAADMKEGKLVAWNEVDTQCLSVDERQRVHAEVALLQEVKHPHIIDFYASWTTPTKVVFITAIIESGDLQRFYRTHTVKLKVIKKWCRQILDGLIYLHTQFDPPIIHRDIKCENVLYSAADGTVRIGDLGLSTRVADGGGADLCGAVLGTPNYMAPELYEGRVDEGVDVYAFGMCALEMASRRLPYDECTNSAQIYRKVTQGILPEAFYRIKFESVRQFIRFCVTPGPDGRRPSARDVASHPFLASGTAHAASADAAAAVAAGSSSSSAVADEDDEVDLCWPEAQLGSEASITPGASDEAHGRGHHHHHHQHRNTVAVGELSHHHRYHLDQQGHSPSSPSSASVAASLTGCAPGGAVGYPDGTASTGDLGEVLQALRHEAELADLQRYAPGGGHAPGSAGEASIHSLSPVATVPERDPHSFYRKAGSPQGSPQSLPTHASSQSSASVHSPGSFATTRPLELPLVGDDGANVGGMGGGSPTEGDEDDGSDVDIEGWEEAVSARPAHLASNAAGDVETARGGGDSGDFFHQLPPAQPIEQHMGVPVQPHFQPVFGDVDPLVPPNADMLGSAVDGAVGIAFTEDAPDGQSVLYEGHRQQGASYGTISTPGRSQEMLAGRAPAAATSTEFPTHYHFADGPGAGRSLGSLGASLGDAGLHQQPHQRQHYMGQSGPLPDQGGGGSVIADSGLAMGVSMGALSDGGAFGISRGELEAGIVRGGGGEYLPSQPPSRGPSSMSSLADVLATAGSLAHAEQAHTLGDSLGGTVTDEGPFSSHELQQQMQHSYLHEQVGDGVTARGSLDISHPLPVGASFRHGGQSDGGMHYSHADSGSSGDMLLGTHNISYMAPAPAAEEGVGGLSGHFSTQTNGEDGTAVGALADVSGSILTAPSPRGPGDVSAIFDRADTSGGAIDTNEIYSGETARATDIYPADFSRDQNDYNNAQIGLFAQMPPSAEGSAHHEIMLDHQQHYQLPQQGHLDQLGNFDAVSRSVSGASGPSGITGGSGSSGLQGSSPALAFTASDAGLTSPLSLVDGGSSAALSVMRSPYEVSEPAGSGETPFGEDFAGQHQQQFTGHAQGEALSGDYAGVDDERQAQASSEGDVQVIPSGLASPARTPGATLTTTISPPPSMPGTPRHMASAGNVGGGYVQMPQYCLHSDVQHVLDGGGMPPPQRQDPDGGYTSASDETGYRMSHQPHSQLQRQHRSGAPAPDYHEVPSLPAASPEAGAYLPEPTGAREAHSPVHPQHPAAEQHLPLSSPGPAYHGPSDLLLSPAPSQHQAHAQPPSMPLGSPAPGSLNEGHNLHHGLLSLPPAHGAQENGGDHHSQHSMPSALLFADGMLLSQSGDGNGPSSLVYDAGPAPQPSALYDSTSTGDAAQAQALDGGPGHLRRDSESHARHASIFSPGAGSGGPSALLSPPPGSGHGNMLMHDGLDTGQSGGYQTAPDGQHAPPSLFSPPPQGGQQGGPMTFDTPSGGGGGGDGMYYSSRPSVAMESSPLGGPDDGQLEALPSLLAAMPGSGGAGGDDGGQPTSPPPMPNMTSPAFMPAPAPSTMPPPLPTSSDSDSASPVVLLTLSIEHDPREDGQVTCATMTFEFDRTSPDVDATARAIVASLQELGTISIDGSVVPMLGAFLNAQRFDAAVTLATGAIPRLNWRSLRLEPVPMQPQQQQEHQLVHMQEELLSPSQQLPGGGDRPPSSSIAHRMRRASSTTVPPSPNMHGSAPASAGSVLSLSHPMSPGSAMRLGLGRPALVSSSSSSLSRRSSVGGASVDSGTLGKHGHGEDDRDAGGSGGSTGGGSFVIRMAGTSLASSLGTGGGGRTGVSMSELSLGDARDHDGDEEDHDGGYGGGGEGGGGPRASDVDRDGEDARGGMSLPPSLQRRSLRSGYGGEGLGSSLSLGGSSGALPMLDSTGALDLTSASLHLPHAHDSLGLTGGGSESRPSDIIGDAPMNHLLRHDHEMDRGQGHDRGREQGQHRGELQHQGPGEAEGALANGGGYGDDHGGHHGQPLRTHGTSLASLGAYSASESVGGLGADVLRSQSFDGAETQGYTSAGMAPAHDGRVMPQAHLSDTSGSSSSDGGGILDASPPPADGTFYQTLPRPLHPLGEGGLDEVGTSLLYTPTGARADSVLGGAGAPNSAGGGDVSLVLGLLSPEYVGRPALQTAGYAPVTPHTVGMDQGTLPPRHLSGGHGHSHAYSRGTSLVSDDDGMGTALGDGGGGGGSVLGSGANGSDIGGGEGDGMGSIVASSYSGGAGYRGINAGDGGEQRDQRFRGEAFYGTPQHQQDDAIGVGAVLHMYISPAPTGSGSEPATPLDGGTGLAPQPHHGSGPVPAMALVDTPGPDAFGGLGLALAMDGSASGPGSEVSSGLTTPDPDDVAQVQGIRTSRSMALASEHAHKQPFVEGYM